MMMRKDYQPLMGFDFYGDGGMPVEPMHREKFRAFARWLQPYLLDRYQNGGERRPILQPDPAKIFGLYEPNLAKMFASLPPPLLKNPIQERSNPTYADMRNMNSGDLRAHFGLSDRKVIDRYELALIAQERAKQEAEEKKQRQLAEAEAARVQAENNRWAQMRMATDTRPRGDLVANATISTREQVKRSDEVRQYVLEQPKRERDQLQHNLERLGYEDKVARSYAHLGWEKMPKSAQEALEDLSEGDMRVRYHPDFDPSLSIEQQQVLKYDNSLRTGLLRQRNKLIHGNNPIVNFLTEAVTAPAKSFINLTMDSENQYVKPGLVQGVANLGNDLMTVFPSATNQVAGKLVNGWNMAKGVGREAVAQLLERQALEPVVAATESTVPFMKPVLSEPVPNQALPSMSVVAGNKGAFSKEVPFEDFFPNRRFQPMAAFEKNKNFFKEPVSPQPSDFEYIPVEAPKEFQDRVRKAAMDYGNLVKDPRYLERVKALDKELGLNDELQKRRALLLEQMGEPPSTDLPFNIRIGKLPVDKAGISRVKPAIFDTKTLESDEALLNLYEMTKTGKHNNYEFFTPWEREVIISPKTGLIGVDPEVSVPHELKHHWTNALMDNKGGVQKYADWLSKGTLSESEAVLKGIKPKVYEYNLNPTEIDAHLMTNLRNDLVNQGYLKDHFSDLTEDQLTSFIKNNKNNLIVKQYFKSGQNLVPDKNKFLEIFNKALPAVVPGAVVGAGAVSGTEKSHYQEGGVFIDPNKEGMFTTRNAVGWKHAIGGTLPFFRYTSPYFMSEIKRPQFQHGGYAKNNFFNRLFHRNNILEEQIRDEYGALKRIPLRRLHVDYANDEDAATLEALHHNPEYIGPEEGVRREAFGSVVIPKGKMLLGEDAAHPRFVRVRYPGDYTTLVNPNGLSKQDVKVFASNDFVSHALHGDPVYDQLNKDLEDLLVEKYGAQMVQNNGGTDAYIRGLISDDPEYKPYQEELSFVPQLLKDKIVYYVKTGKVMR
jgi:hypothetical protein